MTATPRHRHHAPKPPADAVALTAFRELPDGQGTPVHRELGPGQPVAAWQGCEWYIRLFWYVGYLRESSGEHAYALLDAINEEGDIVATYDIPHAKAFRFIYRKLHLRVAEADGA